MSSIEDDFNKAIDRLLAKQSLPSEKMKTLISIKAVAAEAGHSRNLIGHKQCAYPDIRAKILLLTKRPGVKESRTERLLREVRELKLIMKNQQDQIYILQCELTEKNGELAAAQRGRESLKRRFAELEKRTGSTAAGPSEKVVSITSARSKKI